MSTALKSIRGMNDLLPADLARWQSIEATLRELARAYGYEEIRTPVVESTDLFRRSIGEQTDIVEKEMYTFVDNNGDSLTLRPEATASCVRAVIEHGLVHGRTHRLWYLGPMFRHERPQKGRYRQFHQFGLEAIGWPGPDIDAELMLFGQRLWRTLGLDSIRLEINNLGGPAARACYREALTAYLNEHRDALDEDSLRRLATNPLRILDSKNAQTREVLENAPGLDAYIDAEDRRQFDRLCRLLGTCGVDFTANSRLVRGLDYYSGVVFEWITDRLGAQNAVCAGGRYDGLVRQLGGPATPAAGFALGLERLAELVREAGDVPTREVPAAAIVMLGDAAELAGFALAEELRGHGHAAVAMCGGGNLRKQMKRADATGARLALIIGDAELERSVVAVKDLRADVAQRDVPVHDVITTLNELLGHRPRDHTGSTPTAHTGT